MVDIANIPAIMALTNEARNLGMAIDHLNADGRIDSMRISPGTDQSQSLSVMLSTVGWEYPPEMIAAIIEKCQARRNEIDRELETAGITGIEARRG